MSNVAYIKVDARGLIVATRYDTRNPDAPENAGWIEAGPDPIHLRFNALLWDGAAVVDTGQPLIAPDADHEWNAATRKWEDKLPQPARYARLWKDIRKERNARLTECDWTQLSDAQLTPEQVIAWKAYRQALRDVTKQPRPDEVSWPVPPS